MRVKRIRLRHYTEEEKASFYEGYGAGRAAVITSEDLGDALMVDGGIDLIKFGLGLGREVIATGLFQVGDSLSGLAQKFGIFKGEVREASEEATNTLYHTVTSPDAGQGILNGIDTRFFNLESRFGEAFYLSEVPDTTLAELAQHKMIVPTPYTPKIGW